LDCVIISFFTHLSGEEPDITDYIDIKKQVLEVYSEEMRQPPHSRSIDNALRLNALRGNSVGMDYAEAFELIRMSR